MTIQDPFADASSKSLQRGGTPTFASRFDQRLHYSMYVPRNLDLSTPAPLVVVQHGTARTALRYRDALRPFADEHGVIIVAPMFPAGIIDPYDLHNYKFIEYQGIRFDHALLSMIEEVAERYNVVTDKFYLHGFSGGGQFAHRFFYLHPERLAAVSIGAPGRITELDDAKQWWLGTAGWEEKFGQPIDIDAIRRTPVHMVVGGDDVSTAEINNPGDSNWMDGTELTGTTRIDRLRTLHANYASHGIDAVLDIVPGVAHDGTRVLPAVERFFAAHIAAGAHL